MNLETLDRNLVYKLFIVNAVIFCAGNLARQIYAPMLLPIQEEFQISYTFAGLLVTTCFIGYALFRFPSGLLSDYMGHVPVILFSNILLAGSLIVAFYSSNYWVLLLATFIMGSMTGLYVTAGYSFGTRLGGKGRVGRSTGLLEALGTLGSIAAPVLVTAMILYYSWREVFLVVFLIVAIATIAFYITIKDREGEIINWEKLSGLQKKLWQEQLRPFFQSFNENGLRKFFVWATVVGGVEGIAWLGFLHFVPTYLIQVRGFDPSMANYLYLAVFVVAIGTKTFIGALADNYGSLKLLLICILISFFSCIVFTVVSSIWALMALLALMGIFMLSLNTIINSYVIKRLPLKFQGIGFGFFGTLYTLIYSLGPTITGVFAEWFGLQLAMQLMASIFLLVIPLVVIPLARESKANLTTRSLKQ